MPLPDHERNNAPDAMPATLTEAHLVIATLQEQLALAKSDLSIASEVAEAAGEHIAFLEESGQIDPLMGIGNRARLEAVYRRLAWPGRSSKSTGMFALDESSKHSAIILDVDHFKGVNDKYGHPFGDIVLRAVAGIVRQGVRPEDTPGRLGGEEIAVLLPDTDPEDAWYVAERLRSAISANPIGEHQLQVTASFGVGPLAIGADISEGISFADQALYVAKETGRNRIIMYGDIPPSEA
jgi:diguanylate cyclase (GGDEF)-like protein